MVFSFRSERARDRHQVDGSVARGRRLLFERILRALLAKRGWTAVAFAVLYILLISPQWLITPDSAIYLLAGQSLADGDGYRVFEQPQGKYPPGFSLYLAGMIRMGLGHMLWLNLGMVTIGLACLLFCYLLIREHTVPQWAFMVTLILASMYQMVLYCTAQLSDVPFMLLVTAGLWGVVRGIRRGGGWMELGTAFLVLSCWIRLPGIPLALATAPAMLWQSGTASRRRVWLNATMLVTGVTLTAFWLYSQDRAAQTTATAPLSYAGTLSSLTQDEPSLFSARIATHFLQGSRQLAQLFTAQRMPSIVAIGLFWVPILAGILWALRKGQYVLPIALCAYVAGILIVDVPSSRYYLPVAPPLILFLLSGVRYLCHCVDTNRRRLAASVTWSLVAILLMVNLPKDIRQVYRQHTQGQAEGLVADWKRAAELMRNHDVGTARFAMSRFAPIVSYLSDADCFHVGKYLARQLVDAEDIHGRLREDGVDYIVLWKPTRKQRAFDRVVRRSIVDWPEYQLALDQGGLEIFRRVSVSPARGPIRLAERTDVRVDSRGTKRR